MNKVEAAQMRAKISAFLANHPGPHFTEAVAVALDVGVMSAGQMLSVMAKQGLIPPPGRGAGPAAKKKTWQWQADLPPPAPTPTASVAPIVRPSHTGRASVADEVELVMGGTTLIVGRNEITGRIRIIINA